MNIPVKNCSSCMACMNVCARGAVSVVQDFEGFYRPQIDSSLCVKCGACERTCPWNNIIVNPNGSEASPKTFAAFCNDETIRANSSSGGVFSVLANEVLAQRGAVVGVGYKDSTHLEFKIVEDVSELHKLRLSKYFQTEVGLIYKYVKKLLLDGRTVLFSGTSCQIAALYAVLGKRNFEKLITVDIVCHGVPSQKVFEKYIRELEMSGNKVINSNFRDKISGWKKYSMTNIMDKKNGNNIQRCSKILSEDLFMESFLDNLCLNTSCTECKYGVLPRIADITLGDYWGVAKYHPEMDDDKGTSVVLINTTHGEELFNAAKITAESTPTMTICESKLEYAIAGNPCIVRSSHVHENRDSFMAALDSATLSELLKKFNPPPNIVYRVIRKIYRGFKKVAKNIIGK